MKKKNIVVLTLGVVAAVSVALFLWSQNSKNPKKSFAVGEPKVYMEFTDLPDDLAARSGDFQLSMSEVEQSAAMSTFQNQKRDILFVLVYKQFVAFSEKPVGKLELSFKKVSRSPSALLNQYGIPIQNSTAIEFESFKKSKGIARVDGRLIQEADLDKDNFIWGAFATDIFRFKISNIDKKLKAKVLVAEAKKLDISTADYKEKYIYSKLPMEVSASDIQSYMKKYNIDDTERNRTNAEYRLLENRKKRGEDYILEKYIMDLPIQVDLEQPAYTVEIKSEWSPVIGDGELNMYLFSDTRNTISQELLQGVLKLIKKYPQVQFYYLPVFFASNTLQDLTSRAQFCVWLNDREKFWPYFSKSIGNYRENTEAHLTSVADELGLSKPDLQTCLREEKSKEIVNYHVKYSNYLGIFSGPVLYVGGEVLQGKIRIQDVEETLQRRLSLPTAGTWELSEY